MYTPAGYFLFVKSSGARKRPGKNIKRTFFPTRMTFFSEKSEPGKIYVLPDIYLLFTRKGKKNCI